MCSDVQVRSHCWALTQHVAVSCREACLTYALDKCKGPRWSRWMAFLKPSASCLWIVSMAWKFDVHSHLCCVSMHKWDQSNPRVHGRSERHSPVQDRKMKLKHARHESLR